MCDVQGGRWRLVALAFVLAVLATATGMLALVGAQGTFPRLLAAALALAILVGLAQPVRWAALIVAGGVAAIEIVSTVLRPADLVGAGLAGGDPAAVSALGAAFGLVATGLIAERLGLTCKHEQRVRDADRLIIDALKPLDAATNVTKWSHARLVFERELERARRHQQPLALLHVVVDQWDVARTRLGQKKSVEALAAVGSHLLASVRLVDVVAYHDEGTFEILLPDTPAVGALVVAQRIAAYRSEVPGVRLLVGVAPLAEGAGTLDDLLLHGDAAVSIAERLERPYAVCEGAEEAVDAEPLRAVAS
jgi:diguanylate cyclase (GGDEF)-like protein